jgi:regulatory protein
MKAQRSLKGRALQWLAQREQSRSELRRKLLPHAIAEAEAEAVEGRAAEEAGNALARAAEVGDASLDPRPQSQPQPQRDPALAPAARVEAVLDWLEANDYLSHARFAESRVHARAPRFGNLRIRQELKQHQVVLSAEAAQALKDTELQRARAVLERKFAEPPTTPAERARQARFLAGRGFSHEVIARALRRDGAEQHATFGG